MLGPEIREVTLKINIKKVFDFLQSNFREFTIHKVLKFQKDFGDFSQTAREGLSGRWRFLMETLHEPKPLAGK